MVPLSAVEKLERMGREKRGQSAKGYISLQFHVLFSEGNRIRRGRLTVLPRFLLGATLIGSGAWFARPMAVSAHPTTQAVQRLVFVLGHPSRLTVTAYRWSAKKKLLESAVIKRGTTRDVKTVARVASLINQIDPLTPSVHSCPGLMTRNVLQFGYSNGDTWTVYDNGCYVFSTHGVRGGVSDGAIYMLIDHISGVVTSR